MFVLMESENQQFIDTGEKSRTGSDVHNLESQDIFCSVSDNAHYTAEPKVDELSMKDEHGKEEGTGVNYKIIEKHASDPCLTVRIAMTKENPSVTFTENEKTFTKDAERDQKYDDDQMCKYTVKPGFWRPTRRKRKNYFTGRRKKTYRQECMVPGCFTRAYSSRFVEFPDDTERRIDWAERSKLNEKFPGVDPREPLPLRIGLCMCHFRNEDFHIIPRGDGKVCTLKEGVNPSLFPWVELPSNIISGMEIFENSKFSREMRLLTLMKNELYHMMNPPVKSHDKIPVDSCKKNENHDFSQNITKVLHDLPRKTRLPQNSELNVMRDGCESPSDTSKGCDFENLKNIHRKSKIKLSNNFKNKSDFDTPLLLRPRRSCRISKDKKHVRNRKQYNRQKKKVVTSVSNEDCIYDIKIENCEEDEIPEADHSVESSTSLAAEQEQQLFGGFSHFLSPCPSKEILGPVSTQIIASCVEAAVSPIMAKLELFQGRLEGRIEQLEGKVNSYLENLEGRVNLCSEKLEHLINNQHPKPSNVFPGSWLSRCDQVSDNSIITPSNGLATPVHHMEVSIKPFAISEREYEMMGGDDV